MAYAEQDQEAMDDLGIFVLPETTQDLIRKALRHYAKRTDVIPAMDGGLARWSAAVEAEAEALDGFQILARLIPN